MIIIYSKKGGSTSGPRSGSTCLTLSDQRDWYALIIYLLMYHVSASASIESEADYGTIMLLHAGGTATLQIRTSFMQCMLLRPKAIQ